VKFKVTVSTFRTNIINVAALNQVNTVDFLTDLKRTWLPHAHKKSNSMILPETDYWFNTLSYAYSIVYFDQNPQVYIYKQLD